MGICYIIASMKTNCLIGRMPGDYVIAADGGYAQKLGCEPDVVIGDFDSLGYVPEAENVQVYPKQKDDTDMMLAAKLGLSKGYRKFVLLGGIGGRFDHMMANVQTLAYLHEQGAEGVLRSEATDIYFIGSQDGNVGGTVFSKETKGILSVFAYGDRAEKVSICGAEYEVSDVCMKDNFPLGVSNSFVGKEVTITVGQGRLLIVHEKSV